MKSIAECRKYYLIKKCVRFDIQGVFLKLLNFFSKIVWKKFFIQKKLIFKIINQLLVVDLWIWDIESKKTGFKLKSI